MYNIVTNKSNTHQALWVAVGSLSSFTLGIVSAAILSRYFDKTEYGTYRQILYVYSSLLVIFTAGLPRVFAFYLPRYTLEQGYYIILKISKVLFLLGLLFSIILFAFSGLIATVLKNPELETGLKYFSPVPMLLLPTLGIEGIFSTYKKTIVIAIYNTLTRFITLGFIVIPVILFKGTYLYAIYGWLVASFITLWIAYYFKRIPFKNISVKKASLSYREIFKYSIPLAMASLAGIAIKAADQFYISRYFGAEVFADFANGFIELPFVHMITSATSIVLMPLFSKSLNEKYKWDQLLNVWKNTLQKSSLIIYPLVIFFIIYAKEIVTFLYSTKYIEASVYFTIALTINFFNIIVFVPLILSLGETKFYALLHILFAILAWIIGYLIILTFNSPIAIAVFSALRTMIIVLIVLIYVAKLTQIKFLDLFPIKILINTAVHSLIAIFIVKFITDSFFPEVMNFWILIISFIFFILVLIISSPFFRINYLSIIKPLIVKF